MSRLPLVHMFQNTSAKRSTQVPGMETASPFTRFWRKREPIVAAAERANSRAHYGRRTWLKLNRASRSRRYRRKGPGVLLRAPPRSGLRSTSRVKPPSRAVVGLTRRHLLQSQKLFIPGRALGRDINYASMGRSVASARPWLRRDRSEAHAVVENLSPGSLAALQARARGRTQYMCRRLSRPIRKYYRSHR